jgi:YHS domain-containing protein
MVKCPVCGMMVDENTATSFEYKGETYHFMNPIHRDMFIRDPAKFLSKSSDQNEHMSNNMKMN